jgi:hypothetical protein
MDSTNAFEDTPVPHVVEKISRQYSMFCFPTENMTTIYHYYHELKKTNQYEDLSFCTTREDRNRTKTEINDLQGPYSREYEPFASPVLLMDFFFGTYRFSRI